MIGPGASLRSALGRPGVAKVLALVLVAGSMFATPCPSPAAPPLSPPPETARPAVAAPDPELPFSIRRRRFLEGVLAQAARLGHAVPDIGALAESQAAAAAVTLAADGGDTAAAANRFLAQALEDCKGASSSAQCERGGLLLARILLENRPLLRPDLAKRAAALLAHLPTAPDRSAQSDPWSFAETENQRMVAIARAIAAIALDADHNAAASTLWQSYCASFLRARLEKGWYEQDSPGYLGITTNALLLIADHAPSQKLRKLAKHQLDVIFAAWAQNQVGGYPAGPKTRTYMVWALSDRSTSWAAWYWLITGRGEAANLSFINSVDLAVARYRVPEPIARFAAARNQRPAYQVLARRDIEMARRRNVDAALYSWATPSYVLSSSQAVEGLKLALSGGQEIAATLYPEGVGFAPLYLWSRASAKRADRWKSFAQQDQVAGDRNLVVGRLGRRTEPGYAYLAAGWSRPVVAGDIATTRIGSTQVALVTEGGWTLSPASKRFPSLYGARSLAGAWVLVPRRQPAVIALEVAGKEQPNEDAFRRATQRDRVAIDHGVISFRASNGRRIAFLPGAWADRGDRGRNRIDGLHYPLLSGPLLSSSPGKGWRFAPGVEEAR